MIDTKQLKPGDVVYYRIPNLPRGNPYHKTTVKSVTPSGRFTTKDGTIFNPDGTERGADSYGGRRQIVEYTDDVRDSIRRDVLERRIRRELNTWEQWPLPKLERLGAFLSKLADAMEAE